MQYKQIGRGALIGLLLTAPLEAVYYLGNQVVGLPLIPFDLFEWLSRVLPGALITRGIDALVYVLTALGLSVRDTAKFAEQGMALAIFLLLGIVVGAIFAVVAAGTSSRAVRLTVGSALGVLLGAAFAWIGLRAGQSATAGSAASALWVIGLTTLWGVTFGWVENRLRRTDSTRRVITQEPVSSEQAGQAERHVAVQPVNRRRFLLRLGGASAVITMIGAALGASLRSSARDDMDRVTVAPEPALEPLSPGSIPPAPGTRPEYTPLEEHYRIDINLIAPRIDSQSWNLPITGLVDNPLNLTLEDFEGQRWGEPLNLLITLSCISNPIAGDLIGTTQWTGVPLQRILDEAGVQEGAQYVQIASEDGFHESIPLEMIRQDERIMLTYAWDAVSLPVEHGYPLRVYIPDRYGMKQPKWITAIHVSDTYEPGYWVTRGWDEIAQVNATSVIDTVAADALVEQEGQLLVPIGGIAHAGARGISKVEVRVDDGEWVEAQLLEPLSDLTWALWRYDWPFTAGSHIFFVRCTDGKGNLQVAESSPPHPSGATGIHSVERALAAPG